MKAPPEESNPCAGGRVSVISDEVMAGTTRKKASGRQPKREARKEENTTEGKRAKCRMV